MSPYRCSECTLFRCDLLGDICTECLANMPANFGLVAKTESAGVDFVLNAPGTVNPWKVVVAGSATAPMGNPPKVFNYGVSISPAPTPPPPPALPLSAPNPHIGGTAILLPGANKHNAACAAAFLMAVGWQALKTWGTANGHPSGDLSAVHALLEDYAKSP